MSEPTIVIADDPIHVMFGLSYAAYLVVPRSVMQSMPADWQQRMVNLIHELDATIDWRQDGYEVSLRQGGEEVRDLFLDYGRGRRRIPWRPERQRQERKPFIEIILEGGKDYVVRSTCRAATDEEVAAARAKYEAGECDHSIIWDQPGFGYDLRHCFHCGKFLGAI